MIPPSNLTTAELIRRLEIASVFDAHPLEAELALRLERTGQQWRFIAPDRIELYYPGKRRPSQKPCDHGLFDRHAGKQVDIADLLHSRQ